MLFLISGVLLYEQLHFNNIEENINMIDILYCVLKISVIIGLATEI